MARRMLVVPCAALSLCALPSGPGYAAGLAISISPGSWDITSIPGTGTTASNAFTVTTGAGFYETVKIKLSNGGSYVHRGDTPGDDQYVLRFKEGAGAYAHLSAVNQMYKEYHPHPGSTTLGMEFTPPTSAGHSSDTVTVMLTAEGVAGYTYNPAGDLFYKCLGFGAYTSSDWSGSYDSVLSSRSAPGISLDCTLNSSSSVLVNGNSSTYYFSYTDWAWMWPYTTSSSSWSDGNRNSQSYTYGLAANRTNISQSGMMGSQLYVAWWNLPYRATFYYNYPRYVVLD